VRPPAQLRIESQGASHFEIEGQAIVASYSGGVHASYLGYELRCDALRLNRLEQHAWLTGHVVVDGPEASLTTDAVEVDLDDGELLIGGVVQGSLQQGRLTFAAGRASFKVGNAQAAASAANLTADLSGNVLLGDAAGDQFSTPEVHYDGPAGLLSAPGRFVAVLAQPAKAGPAAAAQPAPARNPRRAEGKGAAPLQLDLSGPVHLTGTDLMAHFNDQGVLERASLSSPRLSVGAARLFADQAELTASAQGNKLVGLELQLSGAPLAGQFSETGRSLAFSARELGLTVQGGQARSMTLRGGVRLQGQGISGEAAELSFAAAPSGVLTLAFPHGLRASGDLAALTGRQPVSLDGLRFKTK
jgi:hypothetical protein